MDNLNREQRKYCMSRIKSKNTKAEIAFRKLLWKNDIRGYRLHSHLFGKPDIYFSKRCVAVFIDGCFWHKCPICFVKPKSKNDYWDNKIEKNIDRDIEVTRELRNRGIIVLRFWEHEIKNSINKCITKVKMNID